MDPNFAILRLRISFSFSSVLLLPIFCCVLIFVKLQVTAFGNTGLLGCSNVVFSSDLFRDDFTMVDSGLTYLLFANTVDVPLVESVWFLDSVGSRSSTCPLTGFFWLLSHVIYLKLTRELIECLLSQASILNDKLQLYPKKPFGTLAKLFWSIYHSKVSKLKK